jgi:glycosyltransferase involved in cell wall biosynthesis
VVSAVGGLRESVIDGRTGLHVPPRDPRTLADILARLFVDPARSRRLGAAGVVRARAVYGWRRIAADTARVYGEVVAGRSVQTFAGSSGR